MDLDERRLVAAAGRGDKKAFRVLVERYQRRVYVLALGMVHDPDDARDISQEAFLKAYRALPGFEGDARFYTWLYRIVMNLCIDHLRKVKGEQVPFEEGQDLAMLEPRRPGFDPERALKDREIRDRLREALQQLSPEHRAVILMREVDGLSYEEMAAQVGCSLGTIMSRLFHARKKMQKILVEARCL